MQPLFNEYLWSTIVFHASFAIWVVPEIIGNFFQWSNKGAQHRDRGSLALLAFSFCIGLLLAFGLAYGAPGTTLRWGWPVIFIVGVVCNLLGVALRWYAIRLLGRSFTRDVAVQAGQQVVQAGPYRYIRHPAYSGMLLSMLGIGLALTNWASLLALMICVGAAHLYRVSVEERALRESLGKPYEEYMLHTRRFIPFVF